MNIENLDFLVKLAAFGGGGICILGVFMAGAVMLKHAANPDQLKIVKTYMYFCMVFALMSFISGAANAVIKQSTITTLEVENTSLELDNNNLAGVNKELESKNETLEVTNNELVALNVQLEKKVETAATVAASFQNALETPQGNALLTVNPRLLSQIKTVRGFQVTPTRGPTSP